MFDKLFGGLYATKGNTETCLYGFSGNEKKNGELTTDYMDFDTASTKTLELGPTSDNGVPENKCTELRRD